MKKVLVLGGGFAGVESAIYLKKYGFDVTLVSDREYLYIYPISIWIPTKEKDFRDVCLPLGDLSRVHRFELIVDEIVSIDAENKIVKSKKYTFDDFDYLVIAFGGSKMKPKGEEYFLSICSNPEQSLEIEKKLDELIQKGGGKIAFGFGGNPKDPSAVRGGPLFELMFNIHNYFDKLSIRENFEFTFFAPMPKPGIRMGEKALKIMDMMFDRYNIKKYTGKKIKEFVKDGVILEDDTKIESDLTLFIPAGDGHKVIKDSNLPQNEAGFLKINDYCEVEGYDYIYAVGDVAQINGPEWRAKQGHLAEVMARNTAHNIKSKEENTDDKKSYIEHINILCLMDTGDGAAFVYRNDKGGKIVPMPFIGHIFKKGWGWYFKNSKLNKIPRIPGM